MGLDPHEGFQRTFFGALLLMFGQSDRIEGGHKCAPVRRGALGRRGEMARTDIIGEAELLRLLAERAAPMFEPSAT
ncbi:hypothetical protein SAMN05518866_107182 [Sphingobium sp. YR768]|nr:hypothetical protein SAMN05518866_107182 [Sphingobium sp. YR768]